jgi:hypothetical protein
LKKFSLHLENEYNFLAGYYHALQDQAKCVVAGDIDLINKNVTDIIHYIQSNKKIEDDRMSIFNEVGQRLNILEEMLTLSVIIQKVDSTWQEKLNQQKEKIVGIVHHIQWQIETNKFVIKYAANFTHDLIQLTDKALNTDLFYSKNGKKEERSDPRKFMDQKI